MGKRYSDRDLINIFFREVGGQVDEVYVREFMAWVGGRYEKKRMRSREFITKIACDYFSNNL